MTTHALDTGGNTSGASTAFGVFRYLDLLALVLVLPMYLIADLPRLGYVVAAGAWLVQRGVNEFVQRQADRADHPRAVAGMLVGSMLGRSWLLAGAILAVGLIGARADGLAAALICVGLFTIYFLSQLVVRPYDRLARQRDQEEAS